MKTLEEAKNGAILYLRSDIDVLSEQNEESERIAYRNRAQASLGTIKAAKLISDEEFIALGNEIGEANKKASQQVLAALKR